ncbi:MAG: hypothetical protein WBA22_08075 [Candidatus Methanofastidiosia archaeon]
MGSVDHGSGPNSFRQEIEKAIFNLQVVRNHSTIEIRTPDTWRQKYTVVYRNIFDHLYFARLPPRRKVVQRNLSVYDRKDHRLTIIPSDLVREALVYICQTYHLQAIRSAKGAQVKHINEFAPCHADFCDVFCYDSEPKLIQQILDKLRVSINSIEKLPETSTYCLVFLIYFLVSIYRNFYIPIVKLEEPLKPDDWLLVSYSVENLPKPSINTKHTKSRTTMSNASLYVTGALDLSLPLELETKASNHVRILSPPGMMFRKAGISGLEDVPHLHELYGDLDDFLDDDMVYFHIPHEKAKELTELQQERVQKGGSKDKLAIKVKMGIDRRFPRRLSLVRILVLLTYISAIVPLWSFFSHTGILFLDSELSRLPF